jgi:hypothetical protein
MTDPQTGTAQQPRVDLDTDELRMAMELATARAVQLEAAEAQILGNVAGTKTARALARKLQDAWKAT